MRLTFLTALVSCLTLLFPVASTAQAEHQCQRDDQVSFLRDPLVSALMQAEYGAFYDSTGAAKLDKDPQNRTALISALGNAFPDGFDECTVIDSSFRSENLVIETVVMGRLGRGAVYYTAVYINFPSGWSLGDYRIDTDFLAIVPYIE